VVAQQHGDEARGIRGLMVAFFAYMLGAAP